MNLPSLFVSHGPPMIVPEPGAGGRFAAPARLHADAALPSPGMNSDAFGTAAAPLQAALNWKAA